MTAHPTSALLARADLAGVRTPEGTVCVVKDRFGSRLGCIMTRREWGALISGVRIACLLSPPDAHAARHAWEPLLKDCDPIERLAALTRMLGEPP